MPPVYQSHPSTRVLDYLKRMEIRAREVRNRWTELHYSLVHAFVFDHVHGAIPDYKPHFPEFRVPCESGPRKLTAGQVEMLQRPIRKIVRRVEMEEREPKSRAKYTVVVEVLECGHRMPQRATWFNEPPAKRRRCAECATSARGVTVQSERRAQA